MSSPDRLRPATVAVTAGRGRHQPGAPLNVPPVLSSVFRIGDSGVPEYAREGNPTWTAFEEVLGALEGGRALVFASGIAVATAVLDLLPVGGAVVAPADAYTGVRALLSDLGTAGRVEPRLVDIADTAATLAACDGASLLWAETPTNPLLAVADLPGLVGGAHERGVPVAVDNTFATPLLQRPLEAGADIVVHSATKFISGHSDVLLGVTITRDEGWGERLAARRTLGGAVAGPIETWLALRGLRTLPVRLERAQATALVLATRLLEHARVERVRYPGLPEDPGHERVRAQMDGAGAMLSFDVVGGAPAADTVCAAARLIAHVTSLGGVETSMERRGRQPGEEALPPGLIRLSVGCEDVEDLWEDLDQALGQVSG